MDIENVRVKERIELSLDGRQIASIVVGSLVLLGVVFVLGLNMGKQLGARQAEGTRGDALAALDRPPPAPAAPIADDALTYHERLTRERPPPAEEPAARPAPVAAAPAPALAPSAATPATPTAAAAPQAPGTYAVQLISTSSKAEAEKLAGKVQDFEPRVESAEVAGKGRVYRVRVGAWETRAEAEKALKALAGRTGSKGMVVSIRAK